MLIKSLVTICILLNGYAPHESRMARKELRQLGVRTLYKDVCKDKHTFVANISYKKNLYIGGYTSALGSYGKELGIITIYNYADFNKDWKTQYTGFSKWQERRMINQVLAHEAGHLLGINHNKDPRSIMYKYYIITDVKRRQRFTAKDRKKFRRYLKSLSRERLVMYAEEAKKTKEALC